MKLKVPSFLSKKSNDYILRIYAVVIAILLWFILSLTVFPEMYKTITKIPVVVSVEGTVAETYGLSAVNFQNTEVEAQIWGKRYEIGNYSSDDLVATAIVTGVTKAGEYELTVNVSPKVKGSCDILSVSPSTVKVKFDSIISRDFSIIAEAPNIKADTGFIMEDLVSNPSKITITGAKSNVERIDRVVVRTAMASVLSESQSIIDTELVLYDGETVLDKSLFTLSEESFSIEVPIYMRKTLPFKIEIQNAPKNFDLSQLKYTLSYDTIDIAAPNSSIENVGEIHLGYLDIKKINLKENTFDFPVELSTGFINLSNIDTVTITFNMDGMDSKIISIPHSKIHVINAPSKYDIKVFTTGINNVMLIGPKDVISKISSDDVIAEIDLLGMSVDESTYSVPVKIYCPDYDTVWSFDSYKVGIEAKEKS